MTPRAVDLDRLVNHVGDNGVQRTVHQIKVLGSNVRLVVLHSFRQRTNWVRRYFNSVAVADLLDPVVFHVVRVLPIRVEV